MHDLIFIIVLSLALGFVFFLGYSVGFRSGMINCFSNIMAIGKMVEKEKSSENAKITNDIMKETSNS